MDDGDLTPLLDAMRASWASTAQLVHSLDPGDWSRPTRCPGWDVHDQVAHIVSLEQLLGGGPLPPEAPPADHIRNPFGAHMERGVHALRGTSPEDLTALLDQVVDARTVALQASPPTVGDQITGPMGNPVPAEGSLPLRVFDLWTHEQDIRAAVGRPGLGAPAAAQLSQDIVLSVLPKLWAKDAGAEPGQRLHLVVTGALPVERTVEVGDDGRAAVVDTDRSRAATVMSLTWDDLAAISCGRDDTALDRVQIEGETEGDRAKGRAVLAGWSMSP